MIGVPGGQLVANAQTVIDELDFKHPFTAGLVGTVVFNGRKNGNIESLHHTKLGDTSIALCHTHEKFVQQHT